MAFSPLIEHAAELAAEWHDGTYRKSRWREVPFVVPEGAPPPQVPAMAHLTAVAMTVQSTGWEEEAVAAAFLHDILEDRNRYGDRLTEGRLAELVGERVAALVRDVSEPQVGGSGKRLPWRARKEAYLEQLRAAPAAAVAVSLADKLHNVWTMRKGVEAGHDLFASAPGCLPRLRAGGPSPPAPTRSGGSSAPCSRPRPGTRTPAWSRSARRSAQKSSGSRRRLPRRATWRSNCNCPAWRTSPVGSRRGKSAGVPLPRGGLAPTHAGQVPALPELYPPRALTPAPAGGPP